MRFRFGGYLLERHIPYKIILPKTENKDTSKCRLGVVVHMPRAVAMDAKANGLRHLFSAHNPRKGLCSNGLRKGVCSHCNHNPAKVVCSHGPRKSVCSYYPRKDVCTHHPQPTAHHPPTGQKPSLRRKPHWYGKRLLLFEQINSSLAQLVTKINFSDSEILIYQKKIGLLQTKLSWNSTSRTELQSMTICTFIKGRP